MHLEARAQTKPGFNFKPETDALWLFQRHACGTGYVFFDWKVGHSFSHKTKRALRGCLLLSPKFCGLQQVKIKQQTLGNRTSVRSSFFRLKEQTLAEGLRHKTEQKIKNCTRPERYMLTGRTNTAHLFADQSKLLSAPRVQEKLALNWNTWWPLKHPAHVWFLLLFSKWSCSLWIPLPGCLRTHLPTANYTLSSLLLVADRTLPWQSQRYKVLLMRLWSRRVETVCTF